MDENAKHCVNQHLMNLRKSLREYFPRVNVSPIWLLNPFSELMAITAHKVEVK